jgi:multidrug efflux pump subunit AcrB
MFGCRAKLGFYYTSGCITYPALLPLALGIGQGSGMLKPFAIAIISGLLFQLPLVLVVLPA